MKEDIETLDYVETLDYFGIDNFAIIRQLYDYNGKDIYNVSIEFTFNNGCYTKTLDIYETKNEKKSLDYFNMIIKNIKKVGV